MNSPTTIFNETDLTLQPSLPVGGISGAQVITKRGPIGLGKDTITSWEQFVKIYGGQISGSDNGTLMIRRALDGGSALRINRLNHYTDIDDPTSYAAEFSVLAHNQVFTFSGAPASGHTVSYTDGSSVNQVFDTDGLTTLQKLAVKIKNAFGNVYAAIAVSSTILIVVPMTTNLSAVVAATGSGAPSVTPTTLSAFKSGSNTLFTLSPKYAGADGDNIVVIISAGSNGQTGYWDLTVAHILEPGLNKVYRNIIIPGSPTVANSHYLDVVIKDPNALVTVTYSNLSGISSTPIIPDYRTLKFNSGDDGVSALVAADINGSSAGKTGFYAFDGVDEISQLAVLMSSIPSGVHQAGAAYAEARKDLQYFAHIDGDTEADIITAKDALNIDSSYVMFFGGGINVVDPLTGSENSIEELGDILGLAASSEVNAAPWFSFAGYNRGVIQNSLGANNNFGARGNSVNLNLLANHQINIVINRSGKTVLWGSFTGQLATSQLSLANIRKLHIYLKKALGPLMEQFIEEPCDIPMFKQAYVAGKSFMDTLIPRRAIFDYSWEGDQFATKSSEFKINDPNDISLGKYKVRLFVKDIASLQEFTMNVTLTPAGVSFEDALLLVQS